MEIPGVIMEEMSRLSSECGIRLEVTRFWEDEFRPGWYCRFLACAHESMVLKIQIGGSLWVALTDDRENEVDLFVFVNGDRVGRLEKPLQYLHRRGAEAFRWDDVDEGFHVQKTPEAIAKIDA